MENEPDPEKPDVTRIYVRSLTEETHGNGNGIGLADFAHDSIREEIDLTDTYVNCLTAGRPARGFLPVAVPDDETALRIAYSTTGVTDPGEFRVVQIQNTLEPDDLIVSAPVAEQLRGRPEFSVGELSELSFENGSLSWVADYTASDILRVVNGGILSLNQDRTVTEGAHTPSEGLVASRRSTHTGWT
jgi:hypothetical protein